jgi:uncharacterized membrane protein
LAYLLRREIRIYRKIRDRCIYVQGQISAPVTKVWWMWSLILWHFLNPVLSGKEFYIQLNKILQIS